MNLTTVAVASALASLLVRVMPWKVDADVLRKEMTTLDTLPSEDYPWLLRSIPDPAELFSAWANALAAEGFDKDQIAIIMASCYIETRFDPEFPGDNGTSFGVLQFRRPTAEALGFDPMDMVGPRTPEAVSRIGKVTASAVKAYLSQEVKGKTLWEIVFAGKSFREKARKFRYHWAWGPYATGYAETRGRKALRLSEEISVAFHRALRRL